MNWKKKFRFAYFALVFVFFSCIAQAKPDPSLLLLMPWEYGDMIYPVPPASAIANTSSSGVYESALTTTNLIGKGYLINWLLFTPPEGSDPANEVKLEDLKQSDAIKIDATKPISLPLSPQETIALRDQVRGENAKKEVIQQTPATPDVYHARIFISSALELQYLKELLIPYSPLPFFHEPSLNYHPNPDDLVGYTDFSQYPEGAFVYVVLSGYHYNFIIQNTLFQAVQIIRKIEYEDLALMNFNLSMSPEELDQYADQLIQEANEWKKRDPDSFSKLERFHSTDLGYKYAIFGSLGNSLTRIFSGVWNVVRTAVISATAQLASRLSIDPARFNLPGWLQDRLKFKPEDFLRNAFTVPDWIKDKLKPPKWLTDQLKLTDHKPLRGFVEILDGNGGVLNFKRADRKLTLDFTPLTLRVGPDLGVFNGLNPLNESTNTLLGGFFSKNVLSKTLGVSISYHVCFSLDNSYSYITDNGIFPMSVCNGAFSPRDLPYYIQVKNAWALTSAMTQFAHVESIHKLGIIPKKARIIQGGLSFAELPNGETRDDGTFRRIGAFAPCGQIQNLDYTQRFAFLTGFGGLPNGSLLGFDIYLQKTENFLTIVHEFSHIIHCSLVGDGRYREQIKEYANDVVNRKDPRNNDYAAIHEGVANYFEFIINAAMDYCKACRNLEENIHAGFINGTHMWESSALGPEPDYNIFLENGNTVYTLFAANAFAVGNSDTYTSNRIAAVASFLYDLEDSCNEQFYDLKDTSKSLTDRVTMGRAGVVSAISTLPYPAKLRDLNAQVFARGIEPASYWELVNIHGLNHLTNGPNGDFYTGSNWNYRIPVNRKTDQLLSYVQCLNQTEGVVQQNLDAASNIRSLGILPNYRLEKTAIMEIDKSKDLRTLVEEILPENAIAPIWKKEGATSSPTSEEPLFWNSLGDNLYSTSLTSWTSEYGISLQEFIDEIVPMNSTDIQWVPIGKETKKMGYVGYTQVENFISPEVEHYEFTSLLPEYAANNVPFDPNFINQISPDGCQNRSWIPIGKQPNVMGLECWTAVGYFGVILYDDYCTDDPIEIDQRGNVVKHPVHINDHFRHLYNVRKGKLSCDFHIPGYSDLMEVGGYLSYALPSTGYAKKWNHLFDQKDGRVQFVNSGDPSAFINISGNLGAHLSTQKEKGYFEYIIENK